MSEVLSAMMHVISVTRPDIAAVLDTGSEGNLAGPGEHVAVGSVTYTHIHTYTHV